MFQTTNQIIINIKHPINVICPIPFLESRNNYMIIIGFVAIIFHICPGWAHCPAYWSALQACNRVTRWKISGEIMSHMLHVWYIYLHDWVIIRANVGKYSSTMEHLGCDFIQKHWEDDEPTDFFWGGTTL